MGNPRFHLIANIARNKHRRLMAQPPEPRAVASIPNDLPQPLYCRYGVCSAHEPHMPWCTEFTAGELAAAGGSR